MIGPLDLAGRLGTPIRMRHQARVAGASDAQAQADALKARAADLAQRAEAAAGDPAKLAALKPEFQQLSDEAAQLAPQLQAAGVPFNLGDLFGGLNLPELFQGLHFPDVSLKPEIPSAVWWGLGLFGVAVVGGGAFWIWSVSKGAQVAGEVLKNPDAMRALGGLLGPEGIAFAGALGALQGSRPGPTVPESPAAKLLAEVRNSPARLGPSPADRLLEHLTPLLGPEGAARVVDAARPAKPQNVGRYPQASPAQLPAVPSSAGLKPGLVGIWNAKEGPPVVVRDASGLWRPPTPADFAGSAGTNNRST